MVAEPLLCAIRPGCPSIPSGLRQNLHDAPATASDSSAGRDDKGGEARDAEDFLEGLAEGCSGAMSFPS